MAVCVAILDREQNCPFYVRLRGSDIEEVKLQFFLYACIDVIEERIAQAGSKGTELREQYLGLLLNDEDYSAYGYATCSKYKFVLLFKLENGPTSDTEVRSIFRRLHATYGAVLLNPFYRLGTPPKSRVLDEFAHSVLFGSKS